MLKEDKFIGKVEHLMNKQYNTKAKGFTIIEVVLVLAIAGLIFLMVFIALPALQRGQRDTQRRDDLSRALSQITAYQTNNKGSLPSAVGEAAATADPKWATFRTNYLATPDNYTDPSGKDYVFVTNDGTTAPQPPTLKDMITATSTTVKIYYTVGAICNGENVTTGQGARKVALRIVLEGAGVACSSN